MQGLRSRRGHLTGTLPTLHPHATSPDVEPASDTPTRGTEPDAIGPAAGPCAIPSHRTPDRAVPSPRKAGAPNHAYPQASIPHAMPSGRRIARNPPGGANPTR